MLNFEIWKKCKNKNIWQMLMLRIANFLIGANSLPTSKVLKNKQLLIIIGYFQNWIKKC